MRTLLTLLNPFAPHITSQLWETLAQKFPLRESDVMQSPWPAFDPAFLIEDEIEIIIQVNGKLRDKLVVALDISDEELRATALQCPKIAELITDKEVVKVVVVPKKLVNVVVR